MRFAVAVAAVALTTGCGAGQSTQTDQKRPSVPGANAQARVSPGVGSISVRNVVVTYPGPAGYPKDGTASLELRVFNDTDQPVRLTSVTSAAGMVVLDSGPAAGQDATRPPASPTSAPPPPSPPAGRPLDVEIPARGFVTLAAGEPQSLRLTGLTRSLTAGDWITLTFRFSNNVELSEVAVPVAPPSSPPPRSPMVFEHGEGDEQVGHD